MCIYLNRLHENLEKLIKIVYNCASFLSKFTVFGHFLFKCLFLLIFILLYCLDQPLYKKDVEHDFRRIKYCRALTQITWKRLSLSL